MAATSINYPYRVYRYKVKIDSDKLMARASFSEVSGISMSTQVVEYREGSDTRNTPRKFPGLTTFSNVTFRWGQTDDADFMAWIHQVAPNNEAGPLGLKDRAKITVTLITDDGKDGTSWTLINAWPVTYSAPDLSGLGNEVAITSLEVCCEGIWMNEGKPAGTPSQI